MKAPGFSPDGSVVTSNVVSTLLPIQGCKDQPGVESSANSNTYIFTLTPNSLRFSQF